MDRSFSSRRARLVPRLAGGVVMLLVAAAAVATQLPSAAHPATGAAGSLAAAGNGVVVGQSYHNDTSPPLRSMPQVPVTYNSNSAMRENPKIPIVHPDGKD